MLGEINATSTLLMTQLSTTTGKEIYYTDMSVLYWFLGILIVIEIIELMRK